MKLALILAISFSALSSAFAVSTWQEFKEAYGKTYSSPEEETSRRHNFAKNLGRIEEHNVHHQLGTRSFKMALNQFADLSEAELKELLPKRSITDRNVPAVCEKSNCEKSNVQTPAPDSFDWRSRGYVTPVTDQGKYGSASFHAIASAAAGGLALATQQLTVLSTQQFTDCLPGLNVQLDAVYSWLKIKGGFESAQDYPVEDTAGPCKFDDSKITATYSGYTTLNSGDEENLKTSVAFNGQYIVEIDANTDFIFYNSGVFDTTSCETESPNHLLVVVGYGSEGNSDYWTLKNSWGEDWGEQGYVRLARNKNNLCGVASFASKPIVAAA